MDTIARVRRAFYVQRWSMKKIVRELHVSRNTVRKILRSDETDFSYERTHQPMPRIGPWQDQLDRLLAANAGKPSRERLTLIRIFEELRALGYEGGYDASRSSISKRRKCSIRGSRPAAVRHIATSRPDVRCRARRTAATENAAKQHMTGSTVRKGPHSPALGSRAAEGAGPIGCCAAAYSSEPIRDIRALCSASHRGLV